MIRMIGYELRKILSKKSFYVVLLILLFLSNAVDIKNITEEGIVNKPILTRAEEKFIKDHGNDLTDELYQYIEKEYADATSYYGECGGEEKRDKGKFADTRLNDYFVMSDIENSAKYIKEYQQAQFNLMDRAKENVELYKDRNDTYKVRENRQIIKMYNIKPRLKLLWKNGWYALEDNGEIIFILILTAMFVSAVFSEEKEQNMFPILYTGVKGRTTLAMSKIMASGIFALIVTIIFEGAKYIFKFLISGVSDLGEYIQNAPEYEYCPLNITFGELMVINTLLIALGATCFAVMVCMVSAFCNKNIISLVISVFLIVLIYGNIYRMMYLPYATGTGIADIYAKDFVSFFDFNERYLIGGMFEPQRFFKGYHAVNVGGYPVITVFFNVALTAVKTMIFGILTVIIYKKRKKHTNPFKAKAVSKPHNMAKGRVA